MQPFPICREHAYRLIKAYLKASPDEIRMQHDLRRLDIEQAARDRMPDAESLRQYQAEQAAKAVVYYVRLPGERIKIGTTSDLARRMAGLRVDVTDVLATEPGGQPLEHLRHKQFAADRIHPRREDFRPSDSLMSHIAMLAEHFGDRTP